MADDVPYTPGAGITVAADDIGGTHFQRVKVILGSDGTNLGDVGPTNPVPVSGTVSISGAVQVSGAVSISVMPAVSGNVGITNIVPVTTQASVSVSGIPVWMNPTQAVVVNTIGVGFSVNALVTGVVSISAMPAISGAVSISQIAPSMTIGTIVTVLGAVVNTIGVGFSVNALVTGPVSISAMPAISHPAISGVIASSVPATSIALGMPVWIVGGQTATGVPVLVTIASQTTVVSGLVSVTGVSLNVVVSGAVSISQIAPSMTIGTIVTVLGAVVNTIAAGFSVNALVTGNVGITNVLPVTTQVSVSVSGLPVWMNPTQGVTILGTQIVSQTTVVSGLVSVTGVSLNVVVSGPVSISVMPAVSISVSAALGTVITVLGTQIVSVASVQLQPFLMILSSTVVGSNTSMLMTIHTGNTFVATGTSAYAVPGGKVLRIMQMYVILQSSAVLGNGRLVILLGTATASLSVTSTVGFAAALPYVIPSGVSMVYQRDGIVADIAAGTSIVPAVIGGTTMSIGGGVISGYLF